MDEYQESGGWLAACTCCTCEALAKFFDTSGFHDARLGARVEGVRLRGDIALEQRIRLAINLDRFTGVQR